MKEFQPLALVILACIGVALVAVAETTGVAAMGGMLVGIAFCVAIRLGGEIATSTAEPEGAGAERQRERPATE